MNIHCDEALTEAATRMGTSKDFKAAKMDPVEMKMNPSVSSTNSLKNKWRNILHQNIHNHIYIYYTNMIIMWVALDMKMLGELWKVDMYNIV